MQSVTVSFVIGMLRQSAVQYLISSLEGCEIFEAELIRMPAC